MIALDVLALLAGAGADLGAPKDRLRALAASFPPSELRWRRGAYAQEDAFHLLGLTLP